jgi:hypothetical protein
MNWKLRGREEKPAYTQQELMALVKFWQQKYIQHNTIAEGQIANENMVRYSAELKKMKINSGNIDVSRGTQLTQGGDRMSEYGVAMENRVKDIALRGSYENIVSAVNSILASNPDIKGIEIDGGSFTEKTYEWSGGLFRRTDMKFSEYSRQEPHVRVIR